MLLGGESQHRWVDLRADTPIHVPSDDFFNTLVRNSIRDYIDGTDDQGINLAGISFPGIESLLPAPEQPKPHRGLHIDRAMIGLATVGIGVAAIAPTELARAQTTPETPGDGRVNIVFIGDSIGVGADQFGGLREDLSSAGNVTYDAHESRPLVMPGCDEPQPTNNCMTISDGVRVIEANSDAIRDADIVIVELGTNDSVEQYEGSLRRVLNDTLAIGSRDGEMPIIMVPELFYTSDTGTADQKNQIADLVISDFKENGYDIRSIDLQQLNIPTSDGVHPTGDGARQLASAIAAEVIPVANEPRLGVALPGTSGTPAAESQPNLFERILDNIRSLPDQLFGDDEPASSNIVINPAAIDFSSIWNTVQQNDPALNQIISSVETAEVVQARAQQEAAETPAAPQAVPEAPGIVVENGEPRTYLGNHTVDGSIIVSEGFGDVRDLGDGPYAQGNFDSRSVSTPESDSGEPRPIIAPVSGIIHLTETSGEGNKVIIEIGTDAASGGTIIWYGTHLSDFAVQEGQIIMAGDSLGISGSTGRTFGVHHSTGLAIVPYGEWDDYLNSSEALNPFDYMPYVDITCLDSATDSDGEYCGPTQPGIYYSLPIHPDALAYLQSQGVQPGSTDDGGISIEINLGGIDWNLLAPQPEQPVVVLPSDGTNQPIIVPESAPANPDGTPPTTPRPDGNPETPTDSAPPENSSDKPVIDPNAIDWEAEFAELVKEEYTGQEGAVVLPNPENPQLPNTEQQPQNHESEATDEEGLRGGSIPEKIYNYLIDRGYTHAGALGIMANLAHEGGFDPARAEIRWNGNCAVAPDRLNPDIHHSDGGTGSMGFGIAQWTEPASRQSGLQAKADAQGRSWKSLRVQLDWLDEEIRTNSRFANVLQITTTSNDINEATYVVLAEFEQPRPFTDRGTESERAETTEERQATAQALEGLITAGNFAGIEVACDGIGLS